MVAFRHYFLYVGLPIFCMALTKKHQNIVEFPISLLKYMKCEITHILRPFNFFCALTQKLLRLKTFETVAL